VSRNKEQNVLELLQKVRNVKHNRPAVGARSCTEGEDGVVTNSDSPPGHGCGLPIIRVHRIAQRLAANQPKSF
jgi:hypothetical protein